MFGMLGNMTKAVVGAVVETPLAVAADVLTFGGSIPVVRLSDAEAIIAQKDAEILDQCRINGMGAERELALLGQIERQSAALKLAKAAITEAKGWNWLDDDMPHVVQRQVDEALAAINEVLGE